MADTLICEIVTPVKTVYTSEVSYVGLPGEAGSFGVMQRHEPLVSALKPGAVQVTPAAGNKVDFVVSGGYAQVSDNKVIVLANDALEVSQIQASEVSAALAGVEKELAALAEGDSAAAYLKGQKEWLELQLKTVNA